MRTVIGTAAALYVVVARIYPPVMHARIFAGFAAAWVAIVVKKPSFGLLLPLQSYFIAQSTMFTMLELTDTRLALIIPYTAMGLPLAVIAFTQWWIATDKRPQQTPEKAKKTRAASKRKDVWHDQLEQTRFPLNTRRMIAAGVAAGLLPLVHAHSFVVVMGMAACLALLFINWRDWITFFVVASAIAVQASRRRPCPISSTSSSPPATRCRLSGVATSSR